LATPAKPQAAEEAAVLSPRFYTLAALALIVFSGPAVAVAPPPRTPSPAQVARWVKDLGDDDFEVRESATAKLRAAGRAAEAALAKAAQSDDKEVVRRAREILRDFKWGIYPDTPPAVVELIRKYQTSTRDEKQQIIGKLFAAGSAGCRALAKVAAAETDPLARSLVFGNISARMSRGIPALLTEGNFDALEALLEMALAADVNKGAANYAAYWLLRGRLGERIAAYEAEAHRHATGKPQAEVLAFLYRANGQLAEARKQAEKAERPALVEAFLYEAGDWKELARRPELISAADPSEKLAWRAAFCRLGGDRKGFKAAIAAIRKAAAARKEQAPGGQLFPLAKALFLNDRPDDAISLIGDEDPRMACEALAAQMNIAAARALVDKARKVGGGDLPALEILEARTLYRLGEKKKALETFDRYAGRIKAPTDESWFLDLVDAELRAGLTERAFEHAARVLAVSSDRGEPARLFAKLFPDNEEDAEHLWPYCRASAGSAEKGIKLLRALLDGKATAAEVRALGDIVTVTRKIDRRTPEVWLWLVAGEAGRLCGQADLARGYFEKADAARGRLRVGDVLAGKKQWRDAADWYDRAYQIAVKVQAAGGGDSACPPHLALYLKGRALVEGGQTAKGKQLIEQAHLLPLGDGKARHGFARALAQRGHTADARREFEILRRVGEPVLNNRASYYTGESFRAAALAAIGRKEYLTAARAYDQAILRILRPDVRFVQDSAFVAIPSMVHRLRARGLLAAGKADEALREANLALECMPGNVDLATQLVPELDRLGRAREATRLFEKTLTPYEKVCSDYPKYAAGHNSAAWLSACCRRDLEKGLTHARKAVELSPDSAAVLDTLAEVLFQLGKKDEAVATQKKVVALAPKNKYFRKQLKRIEAGDPKVPRPADEDD
jgi:tetratricopeptide (TPR) repeat protein